MTDSQGMFRLENIRPGPMKIVVVTHPDFAPRIRWNCYVFRKRDTALKDIRLQRGITVRGRMRDKGGASVKGARFRIRLKGITDRPAWCWFRLRPVPE